MTKQGQTRAGWVLTILVGLFLAMDAGMKLAALPVVVETQAAMGWPAQAASARLLGGILAGCLALYLWPRTAVLGAVRLTGYLGGAIATHLSFGSPLALHTFFGVYVGLVLWAALWLRLPGLRPVLIAHPARP